jgi:small subunit ribosomal protein S6
MAQAKPIYDLILLLDLSVDDERRAKIVADARAAIVAEGELLGDQDWGTRPLSYEIDHREAAAYHLLQFHGPASLIAALEHSLRVTDGVVRYRVIKLPAGSTPVAASAPPLASPAETTPADPPAVAAADAPQDADTPDTSTAPDAPDAPDAPAESDPALVGA